MFLIKIKSIYTLFLRSALLRTLAVMCLKIIYKLLFCFVPINKRCYLFQSFDGKFICDSPWFLYKELAVRESVNYIWVVHDLEKIDKGIFEKDNNVTLVQYGSLKYYVALSQASVICSNSRLPYFFSKSKKQTYIQTWHGTPLKRLGLDIHGATNDFTSYKAIQLAYQVEGKIVDIFVSPSPYATEKFCTSFNLERSKILELGYPRNDVLINRRDDLLYISKVKHRLGIPSQSKVILYAPTYRDNSVDELGVYRSVNLLASPTFTEHFDSNVIFLIRGHYFSHLEIDDSRFIDVSHVDEINDLYLASDALVTDYSSVFFDFSLLDKPIYFYMPDLDEYKSEVRGFYLEVPEQLPGRVFDNPNDLAEAILDAGFRPVSHQAFNREFNPYEDGNSSVRYIDNLLRFISDNNNE